jgi:succinate-semialdehyde dehydrogenase/glutarate-semialdehyde dehydrogenase
VGDGLKEGVTTGPLINEAAVEKVEEHIADAEAGGGQVVVGAASGTRWAAPSSSRPSLTGVTTQMKVIRRRKPSARSPRCSSSTPRKRSSSIANDTIFGLASYFYARDIGRITRVQEALEYGMVGVNTGLISTELAPFGGVKQSGLGREGSRHGLDDYMELKYICLSV